MPCAAVLHLTMSLRGKSAKDGKIYQKKTYYGNEEYITMG